MDLNTTIKRLRVTFNIIIAMLSILALISTFQGEHLLMAHTKLEFLLQSLLVAVDVAAIPLAFKLMSLRKIHDIVCRRSSEGLKAYYRYSIVRMCIVATPAFVGFIVAGLRIDDTNAVLSFMLMIGLLMFCPSERLYRKDTGKEEE